MGTPISLHGRLLQVDSDTGALYTSADTLGWGTQSTATTIKTAHYGDSALRRTKLTLTAAAISIADDAGVAQYGGSAKLFTFPAGLTMTYMARVAGVLTLGTTGTIIDTYTGVMALGSVTATTGSSLTSTEATWLQSTAITQAVAKVATTNAISIATALTESAGRVVDGRSSAAELFLNFAIADDATHTAGTGTWTGTIDFLWSVI